MIVTLAAAIAVMGLFISTFMGFFLASFTAVVTSLAALIGLVLLI